MSQSQSRSHCDYPALCRSLAAWLTGESQGAHRELKRGETADRLLEMAALLSVPSETLPQVKAQDQTGNGDRAGTPPAPASHDKNSELDRLREFYRNVEEAEARCCPEDVGFEEWIGVLTKRLEAAKSATQPTEGYPGIAHDLETLRSALERARDALYNGFEPDNQSRALHIANTALDKTK